MKINETWFNGAVTVLTLGIIFYLIASGSVVVPAVVGMLGGIAFNVSLFLILAFGLQKFQLGTKRDIPSEIFDENNVAAAVYQGMLFVALAIVISRGLM